MKRVATAVLAFVLCVTGSEILSAENESLVGTWRITSFTVLYLDTNESVQAQGPNPTGYLQYSPGGHMTVFLAAGGRKPPVGNAPSDAEAAAYLRSIIGAYAARYTVEGNKVVHHVLTAWTPAIDGTDQVRYFEIAGKTLTIKTAPIKSPRNGRDVVSTLTFESVE